MRLRRFVLLSALLILLLAAFPAATVSAEDKTLYWQRWDVDITVQSNSDLHIVEEHEIAFTSGQFSFGFRGIPMDLLEGIGDVTVSESGVRFSQERGERPGTFYTRVEGGEFRIYYFFLDPPVERETRTVQFAYTVEGAVRFYEGGDQVYWEAVAGDRGWPIDSSTVAVHLPAGAAPRPDVDPAASYGASTTVTVEGTTVWFRTAGRIDGDDPLQVRVQFPHGIVSGAPPSWQAEYDRRVQYDETIRPVLNLCLGAVGLVLAIGGPVGVYSLWRKRGRDPDIGPVPEYLAEPPAELPPAVAGTLVDERADLQDVMATLVDLARRGYLVMEEEREKGLLGTTTTAFTFERTDKPDDDLRPYERLMLERVFGGKGRRSLESLSQKFYTAIPKIQDQLYKEVVRAGFFTAEPDDVRRRWMGLGAILVVLAVIGGAVTFGLLESVAGALICLPTGVGVSAVAMIIAGNFMPAKTRKGAEQSILWRAFRTYLHKIEQYTDLETATDQFDRYLPYAVAFGLEKSWVRTFARVPATPMPMWYRPYWWGHRGHGMGRRKGSAGTGAPDLADQIARPGQSMQSISDGLAGGLQNMSDGLVKMLNSASQTFVSRPQSASSGGRGGWSGGGSGGSASGSGGSAGFG
jgi:uncharacterized membrane protein YgcG